MLNIQFNTLYLLGLIIIIINKDSAGDSTINTCKFQTMSPGRVAQSVARLTEEPEVPGSIPGPATYFRFSFR